MLQLEIVNFFMQLEIENFFMHVHHLYDLLRIYL